ILCETRVENTAASETSARTASSTRVRVLLIPKRRIRESISSRGGAGVNGGDGGIGSGNGATEATDFNGEESAGGLAGPGSDVTIGHISDGRLRSRVFVWPAGTGRP